MDHTTNPTTELIQTWLRELGLDQLPATDAAELEAFLLDRLNLRVGTAVVRALAPGKVAAFVEVVEEGDRAAAEAWIEIEVPDYLEVVTEQVEVVDAEVRAASLQIIEGLGGSTAVS